MDQLGKRLVSSGILVALTIFTIFFSPQWFFFLVVEAFVLVAFNEFLGIVGKKGVIIQRPLAFFLAGLIPVSVLLDADSFVWMLTCLLLFLVYFHPKLREQALIPVSVTLFGLLYTSWFFSHLLKMRDLVSGPQWVFYTILLAKMGDAGAYFVGKNYGRMKLIEHISPHKSIEGAVGGLLTTLVCSLLSKSYLPHVAISHLLVLGVLVGIIAQLGDLGESLLKRDAGIKDSGNLPGLGGILDVLDSLLLTIPFVYYYASRLS